MAYWLDTDKIKRYVSAPKDLWPKVYESTNPKTKEVLRFEFKDMDDFRRQHKSNIEVRKIFKL